MNSLNDAIRGFAVNVLGCGCPEEVFSSIHLEKEPGPVGGVAVSFRVRIGGRLMVIGVPLENLGASVDSLSALALAGMKSRDWEGFNRLRIVVVCEEPGCEAGLRSRFERISGLDDRVHLHVVNGDAVKGFLAADETAGERRDEVKGYITEPTVWHEMEGPYIGGREHYQEKSYGFEHLRESGKGEEKPEPGDGDK